MNKSTNAQHIRFKRCFFPRKNCVLNCCWSETLFCGRFGLAIIQICCLWVFNNFACLVGQIGFWFWCCFGASKTIFHLLFISVFYLSFFFVFILLCLLVVFMPCVALWAWRSHAHIMDYLWTICLFISFIISMLGGALALKLSSVIILPFLQTGHSSTSNFNSCLHTCL